MNRRDALRAAGLLLAGGALMSPAGVLSACRSEPRTRTDGRVLSSEDEQLMQDIADTLLPTTASSPGAGAAGVGPTVNLIVSDCYEPEAQQRLVKGLATFRDACRSRHGKEFAALDRATREALLRDVDAEAKRHDAAAAGTSATSPSRTEEAPAGSAAPTDTIRPVPPPPPHYFGLVRELAEGAYWSSEIGMTKALRYVRVPGHYTGCMPLAPGQPAWG